MIYQLFFSNHWGSAIIPYTIDAAFTTSERAVIAQGIQHVEENSCLRYILSTIQYVIRSKSSDSWKETGKKIMYKSGQEMAVAML